MIFINRFFYPDHSATSQMLSELAFALAGSGRHVTIITSRQLYDAPHARLPAKETVEGVNILRVWTSRFGRFHLVGRAVDYVTFYLSATWQLLRIARKGDVVVAKTDPPMLSIVIGPVAWLRGAKLVNWIQDIFPEVALEVGVGRGRIASAGFSILQLLRDHSLRRASLTVAIGERMAQRLTSLGVPQERIRVVANWADGTLVHPIDPAANPLRKEWGLENALVVGYSGNLGRAHDFQTILDAIEHMEQKTASSGERPAHSPIIWLFIGGGAQYENFKREVEARKLSSVRFQPYQPRELLAQSLSVPDVHLVTLRPSLEGLIVPSKYYGVAAAGRPTIFIGDHDGEIARLLRQHDCGIVVPEGDGQQLASSVLDLAAKPELRTCMGKRARAAFDLHYDKPVAMAYWEAILQGIEGGNSGSRSG